MARDMPDIDLRYVLLGRVDDAGSVNLLLSVRRFPKTYREKDFYRLPFLRERKSLPDGFEIRCFLGGHFLKASRYVNDLFSIPCVNLNPAEILTKIERKNENVRS